MSKGRKPDPRSLLAGKRFKLAVDIFFSSYEKLVENRRWETIVKYYEIKKIRAWATTGLPLKRIAEVAAVFGLQGQAFTAERIDDRDFESKLYERKLIVLAAGDAKIPLEHIEPQTAPAYPDLAVPSNYKGTFKAFITERTRAFCGRKFVFDAIDDFLNDIEQQSGYFLITGEPGIGKSAIVSKLVIEHKYPHHFNIGLQSINKPYQFLESICTQLIDAYDLPYPGLPAEATRDGSVLNRLLVEAAEKLKPDEKLVIAIDALDEVSTEGVTADTNLLHLPQDLPDGVYIVATSRRLKELSLVAMNLKTFDLEANSPANREDAVSYIQNSLQNARMQAAVARWDVDEKDFTAIMVDKSEGNFMYLRHVLPAIQAGLSKSGGMEELPQGLLNYYRHHWKQMRRQDDEKFDALYKPVMCILATVKEAVSLDQIRNFTGIDPSSIQRVIHEWFEFLGTETSKDTGQSLYRVYHTAFQEFLNKEIEPGLKSYHRMISEYYLNLIETEKNRLSTHESGS